MFASRLLLLLSLVILPSGFAGQSRPPSDDTELRFWLENMYCHHRYSLAEMSAVTGLDEAKVGAAIEKFGLHPDGEAKRDRAKPLLVLPYPGGRHPRIGFLDGAVDPQRETKLSIFTPWDPASYVVLDLPEALWSNLGLTYLAHTHVDTIWSKQGIKLPAQEWERLADGRFRSERKLPNGIVFGAEAQPKPGQVALRMWLRNGTDKPLSDLRVQMCAMLKGVKGFEAQTNDNKIFQAPFAACRDEKGQRWIIHAWQPIHRAWGNAPCPCLHADPKLPDCAPGATQEVVGLLSFYEGSDVKAEMKRLAEAWPDLKKGLITIEQPVDEAEASPVQLLIQSPRVIVDPVTEIPEPPRRIVIPESMAGRTGVGRRDAMLKNKMTPVAETAVLRGLNWLRDHQNPDGSWGEMNKASMTGFALLCFLGHGETDRSAQYGVTVAKAIDWAVQNGTKFKGHLHMDDVFRRNTDVYEHGICTYALGEYYAMTGDERVKELLRQAVRFIVEGQGPRGGWMYNYDKSADDLSVSGWQIQALKAAQLTGLNLPGVDAALEKAAACIDKVWKGPKGGYGYRGPEDRYALTGAGVYCRLFIKGERRDVSKGMDFILDETDKNKPVKYKSDSSDLYAWYYHTQAALMFGGGAWEKWNRWFQKELVDAQKADGSWPAPGLRNYGPMNDETMTGEVYRTALCILMLEVYYRYLPTTKAP
jgi:hypothetical protein